ncbi:MAG TPA: hypothetical protein VMY78_14995 [Solirubrobacteraceae bacterium]|nr:hypothetical protein [Solirubrobacteraceae bacterium]
MTLATCSLLAALAAGTLVFAGVAAAQAPLAASGDVLPAAGAPEPLWVPDPEPDVVAPPAGEPAADAAPALVAQVTAQAVPDLGDPRRIAIAHWMAQGAIDAGLPGELPVMAALTESGLRNLAYGDRDSVGYFQMRSGIWDGGAYAGYLARPELQLRWFIDRALGVRAARVAAGDASFGADSGQWGDWIADVERPAAAYRGRYASQLDAARALLAAPARALAPFELALTVDGSPAPAAGPVTDPLVARAVSDPRLELADAAREDLLAGRIDPRLVDVLLQAAERTPIAVDVLQTGHSYLTAGGSVSNHVFGRAADISRVGGSPVTPGNEAARDLALALSHLDAAIRPTEIGSPWDIGGDAYFTDGDHQDHLHVGFDDPLAGATSAAPDTVAQAAAEVSRATAPAAPRPGVEPAEPQFDADDDPPANASRESAEPRFRATEVTP